MTNWYVPALLIFAHALELYGTYRLNRRVLGHRTVPTIGLLEIFVVAQAGLAAITTGILWMALRLAADQPFDLPAWDWGVVLGVPLVNVPAVLAAAGLRRLARAREARRNKRALTFGLVLASPLVVALLAKALGSWRDVDPFGRLPDPGFDRSIARVFRVMFLIFFLVSLPVAGLIGTGLIGRARLDRLARRR